MCVTNTVSRSIMQCEGMSSEERCNYTPSSLIISEILHLLLYMMMEIKVKIIGDVEKMEKNVRH